MAKTQQLRTLGIGILTAVAIAVSGFASPAAADTAGADPSASVGLDHGVYRLGDPITGTMTVTNRGDTAAAAGVVVHVFFTSMHVNSIDFGDFTKTNTTSAVLNRPLEPGETLKVIVHASATGFLLAPSSTTFTGRVDYTDDATKTNNWDQVTAAYDTSGQTAVVSGTVFADTNRDGVRQSGETGDDLASPSLWWAPGQGQGVGIYPDGRYSFTGIIGQEYELHFDVHEPGVYVGTSERIHIFTLTSAGRTINYGVAPTAVATSAPPTPAPSASVPHTPGASPPGGGGTQADPVAAVASASPTAQAAASTPPAGTPTAGPTTAEPTTAGPVEAADVTPRSDQSGPSAWLWLVLGLLVLGGAGVVFARRHSARSRAGAGE